MIILQKIIDSQRENLNIPAEWLYRDLKKFGLYWELFPYQIEALQNIISILYLLHKKEGANGLYRLYQEAGLSHAIEEALSIKEEDENFKFLSRYFPGSICIPFQ